MKRDLVQKKSLETEEEPESLVLSLYNQVNPSLQASHFLSVK